MQVSHINTVTQTHTNSRILTDTSWDEDFCLLFDDDELNKKKIPINNDKLIETTKRWLSHFSYSIRKHKTIFFSTADDCKQPTNQCRYTYRTLILDRHWYWFKTPLVSDKCEYSMGMRSNSLLFVIIQD